MSGEEFTVIWDTMPFSLVDIYDLFGGKLCLLPQGRRVKQKSLAFVIQRLRDLLMLQRKLLCQI
jgi:hypothetical protein